VVGIGTRNPTSLLTLKGISNNQSFEIQAFNSPQRLLYFNTASGFPYLQLNNTSAQPAISFNTNGKSFFKGGWLGIGREPSTNLHISSGLQNDAILRIEADEDNNQEGDNPRIEFVQDGGIVESSIGHGVTSGSSNQNVLDINNSVLSGGINLSIGAANSVGSNTGLFINNDRDIGVGTVSPRTKLDVMGGGWFSSPNPTEWYSNLKIGNFGDMPNIAGLELHSKDISGQGHFKHFAQRWGANFYWNRGSSEGERTMMFLGSTSGTTNLSLFNQDSLRAFSLSVDNANSSISMASNGDGNYQGSYFYMKAGKVQAGDQFNQTLISTNRTTTGTAYWGLQRRLDNTYKGNLLQYTDLHGWSIFTALNRTSTSTTEALRITPDNRVGIGTGSEFPLAKLHVKGDIELISGNNTGLMQLGDYSSNLYQVMGAQRGSDTTNQFQGGFGFISGNSQISPIVWMYGHTPRNAFQVRSKGYNSKVQDGQVLLHVGANKRIGIGTDTPEKEVHIKGEGNPTLKIEGTNTPHIHLASPYNSVLLNTYNDGTFRINNQMNSGGEHMVLHQNGNIGIGTNDTKGYKLAVKGHVIAEKVVIRKNENWPDYVFDSSYELPKLSDIESYVKKNKHLPEIPSASEIEENGQDLGEMNKLLLKKVEELTLFIIQQDKQIQKFKNSEVRLNAIEEQLQYLMDINTVNK